MLCALHLKNFVIVESLSIDFHPGFSVLTGETGAGKSILLDALTLVTGGRAESGVVAQGQSKADITAEFQTTATIDSWLAERELSGDSKQVHLRRVIEADGRSRALINGHPATAALLKELGEQLLDIHGQHSAQSLLRADGQRLLLDEFAGIVKEVKALQSLFRRWQGASAALENARKQSAAFEQDKDRLEWRFSELSALKLQPDEWAQLTAEQKRLANAAQLISVTSGASAALGDDDAIIAQLQSLTTKLKPLVALDSQLNNAFDLLQSAAIQIDEAASDLSHYSEKIELDPARLEQVDERISQLFSAARKFKRQPEQLIEELEAVQKDLADLVAAQDIPALEAEVRRAEKDYLEEATKISSARKRAGLQLAKGVTKSLPSLGMQGASLSIAFERQTGGAHGIDSVDFLIAGHEGVAPRPLSKVASGGELSRVGLAIAVLAAKANPTPTLIFDEADAGIGGSVAQVVGKLMRQLGDSVQVLCVTHLPQVAACAHQQYQVTKKTTKGKTTSEVSLLSESERIDEIARMLGGITKVGTTLTAAARKHATELLNL